jgi:hypothetical protein
VHLTLGVLLIVVGALVGVPCVLVPRIRLAPAVRDLTAGLAGMALGAGAILVQRRPAGPLAWVVVLGFMALAAPLHVRLLERTSLVAGQ